MGGDAGEQQGISWAMVAAFVAIVAGVVIVPAFANIPLKDHDIPQPGAVRTGAGPPTDEANRPPGTLLNRRYGLEHDGGLIIPRLHACSGRYRTIIAAAAEEFRLPPDLIRAVIEAESGCRRFAVSHAGAVGLMQIVPQTGGRAARQPLTGEPTTPSMGALFDPRKNIRMGAAYLRHLWERFREEAPNRATRTALTLAAYNAGPTFLDRQLADHRLRAGHWSIWAQRHLPVENEAYVDRILQGEETAHEWLAYLGP
jgi:hypothetical protein